MEAELALERQMVERPAAAGLQVEPVALAAVVAAAEADLPDGPGHTLHQCAPCRVQVFDCG
jgi:hypothetical protein